MSIPMPTGYLSDDEFITNHKHDDNPIIREAVQRLDKPHLTVENVDDWEARDNIDQIEDMTTAFLKMRDIIKQNAFDIPFDVSTDLISLIDHSL